MDTTVRMKIGVRELRRDLSRYLRAAAAGTTIFVTSHDTVIAEIRAPMPRQPAERRRGGLKGHIWMADDFDALPNEILDAMEEWKF